VSAAGDALGLELLELAAGAQAAAGEGEAPMSTETADLVASTRLFVFARHAESTANVNRVVSSDPAHPVWLTARGQAQARQLGVQLAGIDVDLAVATRLQRTQQTVQLALDDRDVPVLIEPELDELDSGDCDGAPIEGYWDWEEHHGPNQRFPRGETVNEALLRYTRSLERLASRGEPVTLVVAHQFALRRIVWVAAGFPSLPAEGSGNAAPYFLGERAVERAAVGLASMARPHQPEFSSRTTLATTYCQFGDMQGSSTSARARSSPPTYAIRPPEPLPTPRSRTCSSPSPCASRSYLRRRRCSTT
jgi:probable phosphoglycerate mutase